MKFLLACFLISAPAIADNWLCREAASERYGTTLVACGVGEGATEAEARREALKAAKEEFDSVCDMSSDCRGQDVDAIPLRSECEAYDGGYRCYRGVRFQLPSGRTFASAPGAGAQLLFGVKVGGSSPTVEGGAAFISVPFYAEVKLGRVGLRAGVELNTTGRSPGDSRDMGGWQATVAAPVYILDSSERTLSVFPEARWASQRYTAKATGAVQSAWQQGYGGGAEYRHAIGQNISAVSVSVGADAVRYTNSGGSKGLTSFGGGVGLTFGF